MCDTMVALSNSTYDGSVLFAKNSDREPNEPHIIVWSPRRRLETGEKIRCTYIEVLQDKAVGETHEAFLFKPSWMWGAEMGVNEKGVVIGNEAVFTREKIEDNTLLGMDILRLALEMCSDAKEALQYIIKLIEQYGQGGKAGYTQNLKYHNSYIFADFNEAYVLETAGRHWVYKRVEDVYSISNTLTIGSSFEGCSPKLVENALGRGWCQSREDFDFKRAYESRLHPHFTKGDIRHSITNSFLKDKAGSIGFEDMKTILRSHGDKAEVQGFSSGSMECVCMHAGGGLITSQTTGSFIVQLKDGRVNIWATGSSLPCISVFKPLWFGVSGNSEFQEQNQQKLIGYWKQLEAFHRMVLDGRINKLDSYLEKRDKLESKLAKLAAEAETDDDKVKATEYAFTVEKELIEETLKNNGTIAAKGARGGMYYRWYWKQQNKTLCE